MPLPTVAAFIGRLENVLSEMLHERDSAQVLTHQDIEDVHARLSSVIWAIDEVLWDVQNEDKES